MQHRNSQSSGNKASGRSTMREPLADRVEGTTCSEQEPQSPLLRVYTFGEFTLKWQVPSAGDEDAWNSRTSARALFLLLLCAPNRQATRSQLTGILWPETDEARARESLRSASKVLRKVLSTASREELIETRSNGDILRLVGQDTFAEEILHEHIIQFPTDQDALYRLMHLLVEQACIDEALSYYEQCKHALAALGKQPADHIRALVDSLRVTPQQDAWYLVHGMPKALSSEYSEQRIAPPSLIHLAQSIIGAGSKREEQEMDRLRRQLLQGILRVTGASVIAPYSTLLNSDSVERLSRALTRPASLDKQTLHYLERRIGNYWQDRNDVILPAQDLLPYVIEDLHKVTALLEGSLLPTVRVHLCSLAGEASMLVGELYYDMSNYAQARVFHDVAIIAAHEANNMALEAVAWARKSFAD